MTTDSKEVLRLIAARDEYIASLPPERRAKAEQYQRELQAEMGEGDPERAMGVIVSRLRGITEQLEGLAEEAAEAVHGDSARQVCGDLMGRLRP